MHIFNDLMFLQYRRNGIAGLQPLLLINHYSWTPFFCLNKTLFLQFLQYIPCGADSYVINVAEYVHRRQFGAIVQASGTDLFPQIPIYIVEQCLLRFHKIPTFHQPFYHYITLKIKFNQLYINVHKLIVAHFLDRCLLVLYPKRKTDLEDLLSMV